MHDEQTNHQQGDVLVGEPEVQAQINVFAQERKDEQRKKCKKCGENKAVTEFYRYFRTDRNRYVACSQCKTCIQKSNRERHYQKNKRRIEHLKRDLDAKIQSQTKTCCRCLFLKEKSEFHLSKKALDGVQPHCKACHKSKYGPNYWINVDEKRRYARERARRPENKARRRIVRAAYRSNPINAEKERAYSQKHFSENREAHRERARIRMKSCEGKINNRIHSAIWNHLRSRGCHKNQRKWSTLVGYDLPTLKNHLLNTIPDGYKWEDVGDKLQIDHIVPRCFFRFNSAEDREFKDCWSLKNLQLLPKKSNLIKTSRCPIEFYGMDIPSHVRTIYHDFVYYLLRGNIERAKSGGRYFNANEFLRPLDLCVGSLTYGNPNDNIIINESSRLN